MDIARQVLNLNINDILPNRFQPRIRFSEDALAELTNSIKEHGVIQPITVRPVGNKYEIVAGERRYKASVLAGKETIPAIVVNLDDSSCAELALIENVQRQDLTPIEEAISYKKILDMGSLTQEALAIKLGKNQSTIANKLRLLNLDEEVQKALLENRISERHARSLLKINDNQLQRQMLERIINDRLTVRRTDEEINNLLNENLNNKRMVGEDNSMNGNSNNMNNSIPNLNIDSINQNPYDQNQAGNNQNYQPVSNIPTPTTLEAPVYEMNQAPINPIQPEQPTISNIPNQINQSFFNPTSMENVNNQNNNVQPMESQQNIPTKEEVNRLIEQANQITPDFNIPNTPIEEAPLTVKEMPTQNQIQSNINPESIMNNQSNINPQSIMNNQSSMPSFNNMEIQPQATISNQMNIPSTPIEEETGGGLNYNPMNEIQNSNSDTNELRPVKFFNMVDEQTQVEPTVQPLNSVSDIFNIQPEIVSNQQPNNQLIPNVIEQQPPSIGPSNQAPFSNQTQPEFIENLEDQAVNMDFGTPNPTNNNFNINAIPNTSIDQPQVQTEPVTGQVNIPAVPTMSSTVNMPNFLNEENQELKPKMPEVNPQPVRRTNIRQAIEEIRQCTNRIENMGFNIDTEEYDLDHNYQIVIKIEKE